MRPNRTFLGVVATVLVCELFLPLKANPSFQRRASLTPEVQTSNQAATFVQPRTQSDAGPLARGIADIRARIDRNKQLADGLRDAVTEHVLSIGEFIYGAYGQKEDPGRRLVELKKAYDDVRTDVKNGLTGQVWQAVGQLGQALLDCASDSECLPAPQYQVGQNVLKGIDVLQQIGWESARLKTTLSELHSYEDAILRDTNIEQSLEQKNTDLTLPLTDDPVLPTIPPGVDLSALDDAVLMNRWLDLGNRAFASKSDEDKFYEKFPTLGQFRAIAETRAPITEVEAFMAARGVRRSLEGIWQIDKPNGAEFRITQEGNQLKGFLTHGTHLFRAGELAWEATLSGNQGVGFNHNARFYEDGRRVPCDIPIRIIIQDDNTIVTTGSKICFGVPWTVSDVMHRSGTR